MPGNPPWAKLRSSPGPTAGSRGAKPVRGAGAGVGVLDEPLERMTFS